MRVTVSAGPARPSVAALASGALRYRGHRDGPPRIFKSWQRQSRSGQHHATQNSCVMEAGRDQHEAVPNNLLEGQRAPNVKTDPDGIQHASNPDKNRPIPDLRGPAIRRLPRVDFSRSALRPNDQKANISPTVTFGRIGTGAWSLHERQADLRFWKWSTADSGRRGSVRREHPLDLFRVSCLGQGQHE